MKKFRFTLQPVAVLRGYRELQARQALAAAQGQVARAEAALAAVRERAAVLERGIAEARGASFRADQQMTYLQAYRRERGNETEAQRTVDHARAEAAKRLKVAVEAHRQLKIVQRLEEHARAAHAREALRAEQNELDERAASRARPANASLIP